MLPSNCLFDVVLPASLALGFRLLLQHDLVPLAVLYPSRPNRPHHYRRSAGFQLVLIPVPCVLYADCLAGHVHRDHSALIVYHDAVFCAHHHDLRGGFDAGVYGDDDPCRDYDSGRVCGGFRFALSPLLALSRSLRGPFCQVDVRTWRMTLLSMYLPNAKHLFVNFIVGPLGLESLQLSISTF